MVVKELPLFASAKSKMKNDGKFKEIINIHLKIHNCNNHKKKKTLSFYFSKEKPQFTSYS